MSPAQEVCRETHALYNMNQEYIVQTKLHSAANAVTTEI